MTCHATVLQDLNLTPRTKRLFHTLYRAVMSGCSANGPIIVRSLLIKSTSYEVHDRIDNRGKDIRKPDYFCSQA